MNSSIRLILMVSLLGGGAQAMQPDQLKQPLLDCEMAVLGAEPAVAQLPVQTEGFLRHAVTCLRNACAAVNKRLQETALATGMRKASAAVNTRLDNTSYDAKRAMEIGTDVALFDGSMYGYSRISRNKFFPLLFSQAVGQASADASEAYRYSLRMLVSGLVFSACYLAKRFSTVNIATVSTSALLAMVYISLDEFEVMIGKKNKFPAIIKQLSPAMLEFMVDRLRVLAQLIASIKEGHTSTAAVVEFLLRDIEKLGMSKTEFMAACAKVVDVEAQDVAKPNCCTTSKHFVQRIVASCWQPLPDWLKTVAQLSVLGGVNVAGSIVAPALIKAGVADAGFDFLVAHATGRAGSALTEEYDCEYKVLGGAAVYGGCRALTTLAGVNTYTVATGALIYLIYSLFSDFSDFVGLKETFMKEFKDLPAGFDELLSIYLTKVRMHIQKKLAHEDVEVGYGPELV